MRFPSLKSRRLRVFAVLVVSAGIGLFFAFNSVYSLSLLPPKVQPRSVTVAIAATHVMLDAPRSLISRPEVSSYEFDAYSKRAALFGTLLDTPPVRERIAQIAKVPADQLTTRSRLTLAVQWAMRDGDAEQRANQLAVAARPYKLEFQADRTNPLLNVYAQAPSAPEAERLADAAVVALRESLAARATKDGVSNAVVIEQLGRARGQAVNGTIKMEMIALTFIVAFGVAVGLLFGIGAVARGWASARRREHDDLDGEPRVARIARRAREVGGDWPRTVRVQPWLFAVFLFVLWLVPFDAIQLAVSMPIDMKFDRLVLPLLFLVWLFSLAGGGPGSPRLRMTLIHVGIAGFVAAASLSVVMNAHDLNQTLEFDLAFKKITLLCSYVMLFVIVASSLRRSEVPAFMKYNLILAVVCALGTIWEYRFHYNVFYELADKILPGLFVVSKSGLGGIDDIGRVMTSGPAGHPLEVDRDDHDGPPDRARPAASELRPARTDPVRARCLRPVGGGDLDVPQDRAARPGRCDPHDRRLPPARSNEARAPRVHVADRDPLPVARRARVGRVPAQAESPRRRDRERPRRRLRRGPA